MRILAILLFSLAFLPGVSLAQDRPNTILVLDGSGSMWGQIDGVNKIVIAREVVGKILADFPAEESLGLTVYGHRERGNCADIETLVAPEPGTAGRILDAVNAINPRGKTPMTDAIIAAAEALRYTEEAATVILVSDGIETCNPDPCAAARALEAAGIDFTAHVVGFDVTEADALAQMQCIAEGTGGQFLSASNAEELSAALTTVAAVAPPAPEPAAAPVTFVATLGEGGQDVSAEVVWDISGSAGPLVTEGKADGAAFTTDLEAGSYRATAYLTAQEIEGSVDFVVAQSPLTVTVVLTLPLPKATVTAQESAVAGSIIPVDFTGPAAARDYIAVSRPDQADTAYVNYTYTPDVAAEGLLMPPVPGEFELRYVDSVSNTVLARQPITVTPVSATLTVPPSAPIGAAVSINWEGPDYGGDYISVSTPDSAGSAYVNYTYTEAGAPLDLQMPPEPGSYEVRYVMAQDSTVLSRVQIVVEAAEATLGAPDTAATGDSIAVDWTGPGYSRDYIAVAKPGDAGGKYENYVYVDDGSPATLLMPSTPGDYELRYVLAQDNVILTSKPVTVTPVEASLTVAPSVSLSAGSVDVEWQGPDYRGDYITISVPGDAGYVSYVYTENGTPLTLTLPEAAGSFEVRYVMDQDRKVLAVVPLTVTPD